MCANIKKKIDHYLKHIRWSDLSFVVWVIYIFVASGFIFRVLFFFVYCWNDSSFHYTQVLTAFLVGLRFDLATSMILIALPLTLSLAPFKQRVYKNTLETFFQVIFFTMIVIMIIDFFYYAYGHKRLSFEFFIFFNDPIEILRFIFKSFWMMLLLVPCIFYFLNKFCKRYFTLPSSNQQANSPLSSCLLMIILIVFSVFAIRGGWQGRPLKPIMAFQNDNLLLGHLGMNGLYNILTTLYKAESYPIKDNWQQNIKKLRNMLNGGSDIFMSEQYPFYRKSKFQGKPKKKNVVIIVMESWGYDDLGRSGNKKNITPFFDQLTKKGLFFNKHYTPGSRTIQMLPAVVSSIPSLFGNIFTTSSYQNNRQKSLANILKDEGYATFFIYAAKKNSMGFSSYATLTGFEQIISKENFNQKKVEMDGVWGVYDEYAFQRFLKEANKAKKPFLGMIQTLHPHLPHSVPSHRKKDFSPNMSFYDDMRYTDFCLEQFFSEVQKKDYYHDTLFVITGDHAYGNKKTLAIHHTPLLFYAPSFISQGEDNLLSSQLDIMPTILEILNLSTNHASMGKSVWSRKQNNHHSDWALIDMDHVVGFMSGQYILIHSRDKALSLYDLILDHKLTHNLIDRVGIQKIKTKIKKQWDVYASAVGFSIMNDQIILP